MGQIFYDMGLLSTAEYVECSTSEFIAPYVGQTGIKTVNTLKKGLGKVLFVDEAYRLGEGQFAKEAIDELVDSLTKPQFMGRLVVILAGYTENMNRLLTVNPGLASRFPEEIVFQNMTAEECLTLLQRQLKVSAIGFVLDNSQSQNHSDIIKLFKRLSSLPSWGNGRDVKTLSKSIASAAFANAESAPANLMVSHKDVIAALEKMYAGQLARCETGTKLAAERPFADSTMPSVFDLPVDSFSPKPPSFSISSASKLAEPATPAVDNNHKKEQRHDIAASEERRDPGVSNETWAQLQADITANELDDKKTQRVIADLEQQVLTAVTDQEDSAKEVNEVEEAAKAGVTSDNGDDEANEQKRRHEEARLRDLKARLAVREAEEKLRKAREGEERKKKEEAKAQKKLRQMGVCPAGFRWIKQRTGYRCAGGIHFVSNEALEMHGS
jgi:hypothetical protein